VCTIAIPGRGQRNAPELCMVLTDWFAPATLLSHYLWRMHFEQGFLTIIIGLL
jgi:hypothetical protein